MKLRTKIIVAAVALASSAVGCESDDNASLGDSGTNPNNVQADMAPNDTGSNNPLPDTAGDPDTGTQDTGPTPDMATADTGADTGTDMGVASPWTLSAHTCVGNRTDALWCDDDMNCYVGCGTTTTGMGLHMTADGGATWSAPATTPGGFFDTARVNDIWSDGTTLFISGEMQNSAAVVSLTGGTVAEVFTRGNQVGNSFTVGNFRRASNGYAIAESLNGGGIVYREADGGDPTASWLDGTGFWSDGDADDVAFGIQLLDMEVYNDQFWGVGSTIAIPPVVMTPKWVAGDFDFGITTLATGLGAFDGEMWGIDINADGVAVGGVNQNRDVGMIYTLGAGGDATDATAWTSFDVSTVFAGAQTWVTDVCRASSNVVYATGRESAQGWGFVLRSDDGGTTFADITPYDATGDSLFVDVSRCRAFDDGLIVAGAGGLFARYF